MSIDSEEQGQPAGAPSRYRGPAIAALVIAAVALAAVAVVGYRTWSAGIEADARMNDATSLIEEADGTVAAIDAAITTEITSQTATASAQAAAQIPEAVESLERAMDPLDASRGEATGARLERLTLLQEAATARLAMLAEAPAILDAAERASVAVGLGTSAWERVLEAEKTTQRAVASYNKLTKAGVTESGKLNVEAGEKLTQAREEMKRAEEAFPLAALEVYLAYIDARIELNTLSQRSDKAWLAGDLTKANSMIAEYNEKDAKAVKQAGTLPASPAAAVDAAYTKAAGAATERYYTARDRATGADERIRRF